MSVSTLEAEEAEEAELKSLVLTSLQSSGTLGKIKAELRSNVYLAFEGQNELKSKSRHTNPLLDVFLKTSEGRLAVHLVREFLQFFNLDFTLCVFEPEAMEGRCSPLSRTRETLTESLGLSEPFRTDVPLLTEIIRLSKVTILRSETPSQSEDQSNKTDDESSLIDETGKSREKFSSITPTHSLTPESSMTNFAPKVQQNQSQDVSGNFDSTFVIKESDSKPEVKTSGSLLSSLSDLPKLTPQSSLGDLPPLSGPPNRLSPVKLGALKKVPSTEKQIQPKSVLDPISQPNPVIQTQKTEAPKPPPPSVIKQASPAKPASNNTADDDDEIEEEMDEFLNSSVSLSEDFTKDETASEAVSLKADYVEKLP